MSISSHFFLSAPATTELYTLSLHDALPICRRRGGRARPGGAGGRPAPRCARRPRRRLRLPSPRRPGEPALPSTRPTTSGGSEEHTSELQSRRDLVCRLLLEKKKQHTKQRL